MAGAPLGAFGDEAALARLLFHLPVGLVRLHADGGIAWLNERAAVLLGGSAALPLNLLDALAPAAPALREMLAAGESPSEPIAVARPVAAAAAAADAAPAAPADTSSRPLVLALAALGAGQWIAAIWEPVADRFATVRAEDSDETRFARLAGELESVVGPFGMAVSRQDLSTGLIVLGPRASEWVGLSGEARGVTLDEMLAFIHPDDRARFAEDREQALAGTRMEYREFRVRHSDGSWHTMRGRRVVESDADGRPRVMTTLGLDVTDAEAAQANRQAGNDLLSRVGHELRTPLNAILGFANLLLIAGDPGLTPAQQSHVAHIVKAGRHLLRLIGDLGDVTGVASGRMRIRLAAVDAGALARELMHACAAEASAHEVELRLEPAAPAAWRVLADATRLRQVLSNLLSNAIKYNRRGGRVTVHLRRRRERVLIGVIDTGIGMTDAQRCALFQPFNRLGRDAGDIPGTGLGLVIVRQLVEAMGGHVDVTSALGRGSIFRVDLPAAPPGEADGVPSGEAGGDGAQPVPGPALQRS